MGGVGGGRAATLGEAVARQLLEGRCPLRSLAALVRASPTEWERQGGSSARSLRSFAPPPPSGRGKVASPLARCARSRLPHQVGEASCPLRSLAVLVRASPHRVGEAR